MVLIKCENGNCPITEPTEIRLTNISLVLPLGWLFIVEAGAAHIYCSRSCLALVYAQEDWKKGRKMHVLTENERDLDK